jgi:hypothetical protein
MSRTKEHYHEEITRGLNQPDDLDYGYEQFLAQDPARTRNEAERLGILSHREGRVRTPYHDPALRALLDLTGWKRTAELSAQWLKGWDHEWSVAMELERMEEQRIADWEAEEMDREHPRWMLGAA